VLNKIMHNKNINLSSLQNGIYFLRIETLNNVKFKKIILER